MATVKACEQGRSLMDVVRGDRDILSDFEMRIEDLRECDGCKTDISVMAVFISLIDDGSLCGSVWDVVVGDDFEYMMFADNVAQENVEKLLSETHEEDVLFDALVYGQAFFDGVFNDFRGKNYDFELVDEVEDSAASDIRFYVAESGDGSKVYAVEFETVYRFGTSIRDMEAYFLLSFEKDEWTDIMERAKKDYSGNFWRQILFEKFGYGAYA